MDVIYNEDCLLHDPPFEATRGQVKPYLECPARLESIKKFIDSQPQQFNVVRPQDYSVTPILRVHEQDYVEFLQTIYKEWVDSGMPPEIAIGSAFQHPKVIGKVSQEVIKKNTLSNPLGKIGVYSFDTANAHTKDTWRSIYTSAQIALTGAHRLLKLAEEYKKGNKENNINQSVYSLCRPPGHHSTSCVAGGYCFINNAAVATRFMQEFTLEEMNAISEPFDIFDASKSAIARAPQPADEKKKKKIMIVDIDFHHGNGTQDIFYDDPSVLYVSLHGSPGYPFFTGSIEETGQGAGEGYNINVPMDPKTTTDEIYLDNLSKTLNSSATETFGADIIVCSMGLDTWHEDPVAGMKGLKNVETYYKMGQLLKTSKSSTDRPVLFIQEGGYTIEKLGLLAGRVLQGYLS
ncbi:hypothetical protein BDC45DRAFT_558219 [Circinella umbellata]|nr:hypothetical protein BDC45DRAFT_558219 [Circinella umbellata]